jgi:hypothetical protein
MVVKSVVVSLSPRTIPAATAVYRRSVEALSYR